MCGPAPAWHDGCMTSSVQNLSVHQALTDIWWMARRYGERLDASDARTLDEAFATALAHGVTLRQGNQAEAMWAAGEVPAPAGVTLAQAAATIAFYARRYAHNRGTYATSMYNAAARTLSTQVDLGANIAVDGTIYAADGMGSGFDGLTNAERAIIPPDVTTTLV